MYLTFLGATREVTGSCFMLEACGKTMLIDCGMKQGSEYNEQNLEIVASSVDYVFLTHAHIDHSGLLPLLVKKGFKGQIFATEATKALCEIMLKDSAHIQEYDAEISNRKGQRAGREPVEPLYNMIDAISALKLVLGCPYNVKISVAKGIEIRFADIGHLLGSAAVEIWLTEDEIQKKLVFSGDIGNTDLAIVKDPSKIDDADYVITESTYGNRVHDVRHDLTSEAVALIEDTFERGGNMVIPAFAVGRTQEILYMLREIKEKGLIKNYPKFEVYVDSPLANEATQVFMKNFQYCDNETRELIKKGINPLTFDGLKLSITTEESKAINFDKKPKIIISASGMCDAGRIRHHLKHNLWKPNNTIAFVGYQAEGTLGRILLDGKKTHVKIMGEDVGIHAKIVKIEGVSGHADRLGLLEWAKGFKKSPSRFFVVHGSEDSALFYGQTLVNELGVEVSVPLYGGKFDLITNEMIRESLPKPDKQSSTKEISKSALLHNQLSLVSDNLTEIVASSRGWSNNDIRKMTEEITDFCRKWSQSNGK